jgi:hypothetical protein
MLIGGVAAGIVGGRMLPPLIAALRGSRRVRGGGDPFSELVKDHQHIQWLLDEMATTGVDAGMRRMHLFLGLKRKLAKHALAEEDVVYPLVGIESGDSGKRKHLYEEHADMKILLHEIERAVKQREDWLFQVMRLRDLVRRHVEEEESTVFPELRSQLGQSRSPAVSGQIAREEALIV